MNKGKGEESEREGEGEIEREEKEREEKEIKFLMDELENKIKLLQDKIKSGPLTINIILIISVFCLISFIFKIVF